MSTALLAWYDANARVLPWRVPPRSDERPDPYRIWLSEVMLQQTTVAAVKDYFATFTRLWPTVEALAAAKDEDVMARWAGLGYYARARNLLKCARAVAERGGFPDTVEGLRALPGIGPYTAAAVAAIAFGRPETVVDGNVERVMARLHAVQEPLPASKPVLVAHAAALTPEARAGDYAQAVMDLGATICTPKSPACGICPCRAPCKARAEGIAAELPRKTPKKPKPVRLGHVFVIRREDGAFLLERRPDRGLLGGMLGWPGSDWGEAPEFAPPVAGALEEVGEVRHTFTHFHLILRVHAGRVDGAAPDGLGWQRLSPAALPTVMRKAYDLAATSPALNVAGD
ncbi:A/G-specific adenine glycosylase [Vannielia litorea]|uniref:Adenine DNA glycosylase n=1 Tax=Vannielia litorea TaxID=1217970 RepID=A0A1N6HP29_9RHOB|nr:A/G-specific adenine glycosylase [Vannielia litorea]SIO21466.1 A/G-specific DNA-adenine glycosylase [Vannielia litorea]